MASSMMHRTIANIDCLIAEPQVPTSETLLCLHGIGGDHASFLPQLEGLSDRLRVVVWNMPGYGKSTMLSPMTFEALAKALKQLISELNTGPVHIMGQSIGGMVAQELFHRYPETVKSLILVATTTVFGGKDDSFKEAFLAARLKPLDDGLAMSEIAQQAIPSIVGTNTSHTIVQSAIDSMASVDSDVYREVLQCLVTFNRRLEWTDVTCPVLAVAGSEDSNAPAATMRKMAEKLLQTQFYELEGAGHLVNLEKGDDVNNLTQQFISQINC